MDQDADDLAELLNPRSREERYYAVLDEQKELLVSLAARRMARR